jgi:tRNA 2-thiouridine synthesizing protein D
MKYLIQINTAPCQSQVVENAYQFIKAALLLGHQILRVFFYQDGIFNGLTEYCLPEEQRNITRRWSALAKEFGVDLVLCVSAAARRGLSLYDSEQTTEIAQKLAPGFRLGGLGLWMEAGLEADRFLVFGD